MKNLLYPNPCKKWIQRAAFTKLNATLGFKNRKDEAAHFVFAVGASEDSRLMLIWRQTLGA
jgi:hypothetical protein